MPGIRFGDSLRVAMATIGTVLLTAASVVQAQERAVPERTGQQVYESVCISCHGPDGKGTAELAKIIRLPDFSDCNLPSASPTRTGSPSSTEEALPAGSRR
jgi:hypothetical protein